MFWLINLLALGLAASALVALGRLKGESHDRRRDHGAGRHRTNHDNAEKDR